MRSLFVFMTRFIGPLIVLLFSLNTKAVEPDWTLYGQILADYVAPGRHGGLEANMVNYRDLKNDPRFAELCDMLEAFDVSQLADVKEHIAFYLNAYNILAIKKVLDNWPVIQVRSLGTMFKPVWRHHAGVIGGNNVTLSYLEHDVLRATGDPRIHFGLNCASLSCPDLRLEPYRGERLNEQLDDQVRLFLQQKNKGATLVGGQLLVSSLFDWFEEDFESSGGYDQFIRRYLPDLSPAVTIEPSLPYNWNLNSVLNRNELRRAEAASFF